MVRVEQGKRLVKEGVIMPGMKEREREKNQKEERQTDGVVAWDHGVEEKG